MAFTMWPLLTYADARKWFKGPKITVSGEDMTEEQQVAVREGSVQIEGVPVRPGSDEGDGIEKTESTTKH